METLSVLQNRGRSLKHFCGACRPQAIPGARRTLASPMQLLASVGKKTCLTMRFERPQRLRLNSAATSHYHMDTLVGHSCDALVGHSCDSRGALVGITTKVSGSQPSRLQS